MSRSKQQGGQSSNLIVAPSNTILSTKLESEPHNDCKVAPQTRIARFSFDPGGLELPPVAGFSLLL
jgi:hypothetical protein